MPTWPRSAAAHRGEPALRLAPLGQLRHPLSVDLYLEQTVAHARCVVLRLLGGLDYWRYGAEELAALCRARGIALAVLPGDGRPTRRWRLCPRFRQRPTPGWMPASAMAAGQHGPRVGG